MISVKGFSVAFGKISAGFGVGFIAFELSNMATNSTAWAVAISVVCQAIFAYFISRPRLVSAQSAALVAERQQAMTEWATLLSQNNEIHSEQIKTCRRENKELSAKVALIRISKHNAIDACQAAYLHITFLESLMKDATLTIPEFKQRSVNEIVGAEDEALLKLINGDRQ